jgi:hypothetical protein
MDRPGNFESSPITPFPGYGSNNPPMPLKVNLNSPKGPRKKLRERISFSRVLPHIIRHLKVKGDVRSNQPENSGD